MKTITLRSTPLALAFQHRLTSLGYTTRRRGNVVRVDAPGEDIAQGYAAMNQRARRGSARDPKRPSGIRGLGPAAPRGREVAIGGGYMLAVYAYPFGDEKKPLAWHVYHERNPNVWYAAGHASTEASALRQAGSSGFAHLSVRDPNGAAHRGRIPQSRQRPANRKVSRRGGSRRGGSRRDPEWIEGLSGQEREDARHVAEDALLERGLKVARYVRTVREPGQTRGPIVYGEAALYHMTPPYLRHKLVLVSTTSIEGDRETYIFPSDETGRMKHSGELYGSKKDETDHKKILEGIGYKVVR